VVVAAVTALMAGMAPASAADTVGSDLAASPDAHFGGSTSYVQDEQAQGVALPLTAPAPGVVVQVKVRHASPTVDATGGFSILSGEAPDFTARTIPNLPDFAWVNGQPPNIRTFALNPGAPIAAGERLAYRSVAGNSPDLLKAQGGVIRLNFTNHTAGVQTYLVQAAFEQLTQMRIEPDVDVDGLGDETQDNNVASACAGLKATQLGTSGDDVLIGTDGDDVIATGGGDDLVRALGGNDIICGGGGQDKLKGGAGIDKLYGENGRDKLRGGADKDYCNGGAADDSAKRCEKTKHI
jgi:Ca2+-binding RTX toxin-like protein